MLIYGILYLKRYRYICSNKNSWRVGAGELEGRRQPTCYGCIHTHIHIHMSHTHRKQINVVKNVIPGVEEIGENYASGR